LILFSEKGKLKARNSSFQSQNRQQAFCPSANGISESQQNVDFKKKRAVKNVPGILGE